MWGWCTYVVRKGDTLSGIARRYGTTVWNLASHNGIANPNLIRSGRVLHVPCGKVDMHPPKPPMGKPGPLCWYRVKPGDTLSRIAMWTHTSVWALTSWNHIMNPNRIYAGTWLRVC
jgi:LysM repeat protein